MKIKEKLRQCYQILFKGRDFIKELQDAEKDYQAKLREPKELAEKLKERLEFLINSATPAFMAVPDPVMCAERVAVYEVNILPPGGAYRPEYSEIKDVCFVDLQKADVSYRFGSSSEKIASCIDYYYERAAQEFAKLLIQKKLLRVKVYRHEEDYNFFTAKFEVLFYKGK